MTEYKIEKRGDNHVVERDGNNIGTFRYAEAAQVYVDSLQSGTSQRDAGKLGALRDAELKSKE